MKINTPLKQYLVEAGISEADFAAQLSRVRGSPASQPLISCWVTGLRRPSLTTKAAIAAATHGKVPVESWADFEPRKIAKAKAA